MSSFSDPSKSYSFQMAPRSATFSPAQGYVSKRTPRVRLKKGSRAYLQPQLRESHAVLCNPRTTVDNLQGNEDDRTLTTRKHSGQGHTTTSAEMQPPIEQENVNHDMKRNGTPPPRSCATPYIPGFRPVTRDDSHLVAAAEKTTVKSAPQSQ